MLFEFDPDKSQRDHKTTGQNLESRFDADEDVLDYFDLSKASRPLREKPPQPAGNDAQSR